MGFAWTYSPSISLMAEIGSASSGFSATLASRRDAIPVTCLSLSSLELLNINTRAASIEMLGTWLLFTRVDAVVSIFFGVLS